MVIKLDDNSVLATKIRKYCRLKGYTHTSYCQSALELQIDGDIEELAASEPGYLVRLYTLESEVEMLRSLVEQLRESIN